MKVARRRTPVPTVAEVDAALDGHLDRSRYRLIVKPVSGTARRHPDTLRVEVDPFAPTDREVVDVAARLLPGLPGVADLEVLPGDGQRHRRVRLHLHRTIEVDDGPADPSEDPERGR